MPDWATIILAIAAVIGAVGVIWKKVIHPFVIGVALFEQNVPTLLAIATQFRSDGGSSLRDVVTRLEAAAADNRSSTEELRRAFEAARQLAEADRSRVDRLIGLLDSLDAKVTGPPPTAPDHKGT